MPTKQLIIIAGATASGKTGLAIELANQLQTEILSCDSRQFFQEMAIGTAKPDASELAAAPHHFVGHLSIKDSYSVGDYEKDALDLLKKLFIKHNQVIMVGGSGLYVKAVCEGLDVFPNVPIEIRESLKQKYEENGLAYLQSQLQELDPQYYAVVDQHNPQRLIRALEVCLASGQPYSSFRQQKKAARPFRVLHFALQMERSLLYERINRRVDQMMAAGLLEEVKGLLPYAHLNALQTVGYKELFDYLRGLHSLETAVELIKRNTRRYAKRQLTWLRKQANVMWIKGIKDIEPFF